MSTMPAISLNSYQIFNTTVTIYHHRYQRESYRNLQIVKSYQEREPTTNFVSYLHIFQWPSNNRNGTSGSRSPECTWHHWHSCSICKGPIWWNMSVQNMEGCIYSGIRWFRQGIGHIVHMVYLHTRLCCFHSFSLWQINRTN